MKYLCRSTYIENNICFFLAGKCNCPGVHRLGSETEKGEEMKKQFGRLSEVEQEKTEKKYHLMNPADFDDMMSEAETARRNSLDPSAR